MKKLPLQARTLKLLAVIIPLLALFIYVGLRSGPLAPVAVTVLSVPSRSITPALFGIGTVDARYTYRIGPTVAGRLKGLDVHVGDRVQAGQVLGEMEPIDLDDRIRAQDAASKRSEAALREAEARQTYAQSQLNRYEQLFVAHTVSAEATGAKRQELQIANANRAAAREELLRTRADREGLLAQRSNLSLIAPVDGVVAARNADPGTTIVGGQTVIEIIDPNSYWINVRFDQISAAGLATGLPARIALRSRGGQTINGQVLRVEPKADAVTEEILAKVSFESIPDPLPPLGELAEVTVDLPTRAAVPSIPDAAIRKNGDQTGVWQMVDGDLHFAAVKFGASDLDGWVQVLEGLHVGDQVVTYSEKALTAKSRIRIVDQIPGVSP